MPDRERNVLTDLISRDDVAGIIVEGTKTPVSALRTPLSFPDNAKCHRTSSACHPYIQYIHPNAASQYISLNLEGRNRIAVVTTYVDSYIFPKTIQGIERVLFERGYSVQISFTDYVHFQ